MHGRRIDFLTLGNLKAVCRELFALAGWAELDSLTNGLLSGANVRSWKKGTQRGW
jgi:hypothetical protein